MGCDIHIAIERRRDKNSRWEHVFVNRGFNWTYRNYPLFAALADVRNNWGIKPIDHPRGFPKDISENLKMLIERDDPWFDETEDYYYLGEHSFSYLTLNELKKYKGWNKKIKWDDVPGPLREQCEEFFRDVIDVLAALKSDPDDVRIVFGFDS